MISGQDSFAIVKECYQWAWVLHYGTAFFETTTYHCPRQFHYLHHSPQPLGLFPSDDQPAIALPPETFLALLCGDEKRPPMVNKIQRLASAFEEFLTGFPALNGLPLKELVLFKDYDHQAVGVISQAEFLTLHPR